jgi:hypothetical protein
MKVRGLWPEREAKHKGHNKEGRSRKRYIPFRLSWAHMQVMHTQVIQIPCNEFTENLAAPNMMR